MILVAGDPRYVSPCRFAIALRSGLRKSRVDVYEVSREWDAQPTLIAQHTVQEDIKVAILHGLCGQSVVKEMWTGIGMAG